MPAFQPVSRMRAVPMPVGSSKTISHKPQRDRDQQAWTRAGNADRIGQAAWAGDVIRVHGSVSEARAKHAVPLAVRGASRGKASVRHGRSRINGNLPPSRRRSVTAGARGRLVYHPREADPSRLRSYNFSVGSSRLSWNCRVMQACPAHAGRPRRHSRHVSHRGGHDPDAADERVLIVGRGFGDHPRSCPALTEPY